MSEIVQNQYSSWQAENSGKWIYNGYIYVGKVDTDPLIEANRVRVYYIDENEQEVDLIQPIRTNSSGFPVISETNPTVITVRADNDYSVKVLNKKGAQEWYIPKASTLNGVISIDNIDGLSEELKKRAVYLTLAEAADSNLSIDEYVVVTDYGNALHKVVNVSDTGADNYLPLTASTKLRLSEFGVLKISYFGVSNNIAEDYTDQIESLIAARTGKRKYVDFEDYRLRFTRQLNFNEIWVKSSGAELLKDFDGTGVVISGGSYYFRLRGDLRVTGLGAGFADGATATTNGDANGIVISGCRLDIDGRFEATNHQGNGFFVNCNGNMNRSIIKAMYASSNNVRGIRFTGTRDDAAVWDISTYTTANYEGGVFVDDDFQGRQWKWFCYNEASNNPDGLYGVYIGRLRASEDVQIYSEEQTLTGFEINIASNCQNLKVVDFRNNRSNNESVETCSLISGNGGLWSQEGLAYDLPVRSTALTDSVDRAIIKQTYGSSNYLLRQEITKGNGESETQLNARTNNINVSYGASSTVGNFFAHYGVGFAQETTFTYGGTREAVADTATGPVFKENHLCRPSGVDRTATTVTHNLDSVVGNRPVSSIVWAVSNNTLTPIDSLKLNPDGSIELLQIGDGIIAKSPDGTRYKLTPQNGGGTATWDAV